MILNAKSGGGHHSAEEVCASFAEQGCACVVTTLAPSADLAALAREDGLEVVWVAAGGDGTVNAVAGIVAGTERCMGVLPLGTLNHFARDLKMPQNLDEAVAVLARCGSMPLDVAEANGRIFVNCSSLGIYPEVVEDRDRMTQDGHWTKWSAMVVAAAKAFLRFRQLEVEVEVDGTVRRWRTPLLFVGNNIYEMGGDCAGQRKRLDQGVISVVVATHMSRWTAARMLLSALVGGARRMPELENLVATKFTVRTKKRMLRVAFDGEVMRLAPPLHYRILAGALSVIVPDGPREAVD